MPAQLMSLNEQLLNLKIVYEHAVFSDMRLKTLKKSRDRLQQLKWLSQKEKNMSKGGKARTKKNSRFSNGFNPLSKDELDELSLKVNNRYLVCDGSICIRIHARS
jgi:hypothetical protein